MTVAPTDQKLISIIIATYNCSHKIEKTLQSIFCQNRDLFEVIILDAVSTDDTLEYIKKYEDELTLVSEKDGGIYYAFNKGIDLSNGKYLYFVGAGDLLKPGILDQIKEFLPPDIPSIIYGKVFFTKQKMFNGREFTGALFIRDNLCQQGMFYHRDVFEITGKFDLKYRVFADWFFNLRCFLNNAINKQYIDYVIADYEEGGISSRISNDQHFKKDFPQFVRKRFGIFKSILCRAFLTEPYIFNFIYYSNYNLLPRYLAANYSLPKNLVLVLNPFVMRYRSLKKSLKGKN